MKTKHDREMLRVFDKVYKRLTSRGIKPTFHVMENEVSSAVMDWLQQVKQVDAQKVSPHNHRANVAERMIETGKHHLISGIAGTNENFPIPKRYRLIPQTQRTLIRLMLESFNKPIFFFKPFFAYLWIYIIKPEPHFIMLIKVTHDMQDLFQVTTKR